VLNNIRYWLTIFLSVCITACSSTQIISSGDRLKDNSHTIVVLLHNDQSIKFYPEKYTVNSKEDSTYIKGVGTVSDGRDEIFNGSIDYRDIREIRVIESTVFGDIIPFALGAIAATTFILLLLDDPFWGSQ